MSERLEKIRDAARDQENEIDALKAEVERLKARNESIAFELGTAQGQRQNAIDERDRLKDERDEAIKGFENAVATFASWKAENERLLSVVDATIQDLARANEVGVALVRERDQAREALREALAVPRWNITCLGSQIHPAALRILEELETHMAAIETRALGGGG